MSARSAGLDGLLRGNPYPGRGIAVGTSLNGKAAVAAYFIMGRSENSRNRIFARRDGALFTEPYDLSRVTDPSLILYAAVRQVGDHLIVANGDQSDTVADALCRGEDLASALATRTYEPDAPHYTPRITALLTYGKGEFSYRMSILKRSETSDACVREFRSYASVPGLGHLIHTYRTDGDPLPSFAGDPVAFAVPDEIDGFTASVWDALDSSNRISLYVRYTDLSDGTVTERIVNRNGGSGKEI